MSECIECEAGKHKNVASDGFCTSCDVNTFSLPGSLNCENCPPGTSTNSKYDSPYCYCDLGMAPVATNNITNRHTCVACEAGKFRSDYTADVCSPCSTCPLQDQRITQACTLTSDTVCGACQPNSNLPVGEDTRTFCNCNAGYEANETNDECVACDVGKYRNTNTNNSIV